MEETLDTVDDEGIEEEADAEVDKVLFELTDGKLGQAGKVGGELPVCRDVSALKQAVLIRRRTRKRRRRMWPRCRECRGRCRTSSAGEGAVRGFGWTGVKCHRGRRGHTASQIMGVLGKSRRDGRFSARAYTTSVRH